MTRTRHFMTVEWCKNGKRGIFCDSQGEPFVRDEPLTTEQMCEFLGPFWLILSPESTEFTIAEATAHSWWVPLAEYSDQYGIARREDGDGRTED